MPLAFQHQLSCFVVIRQQSVELVLRMIQTRRFVLKLDQIRVGLNELLYRMTELLAIYLFAFIIDLELLA